MFSIIIPSFNNLRYLQLCINSIKKNSSYEHEIIVHVNEGSDGTLDYLSKGHQMADIPAILGSLDIVFGEVDR